MGIVDKPVWIFRLLQEIQRSNRTSFTFDAGLTVLELGRGQEGDLKAGHDLLMLQHVEMVV